MTGFLTASKILRHRTHLNGREHLDQLPHPVIFTVTHDSYFEVPALYNVYKGITPRPHFTVMAKEEFLNGQYLSSNFTRVNPVIRSFFSLLDRSGGPRAVFDKLNLISIPRPFADTPDQNQTIIKQQIAAQFEEFRKKISDDFSSLIFPEGTTWGYGGLRKIRSAIFQLVHTSYTHTQKKVFLLPINVKVDKLAQGYKDVFINIGKPLFLYAEKEEFNQRLFLILQGLHTITFSQVGAYYLKLKSQVAGIDHAQSVIEMEQMTSHLKRVIGNLQIKVGKKALPAIDPDLINSRYLQKKIKRFINYCLKQAYLQGTDNPKQYRIHYRKILKNHPIKLFRKLNPLGFHANELASLGEEIVAEAFDNR